ncbi:MAG: hypothetical protein ABID38_01285 [Candidatus Diapherotrites archaeon]
MAKTKRQPKLAKKMKERYSKPAKKIMIKRLMKKTKKFLEFCDLLYEKLGKAINGEIVLSEKKILFDYEKYRSLKHDLSGFLLKIDQKMVSPETTQVLHKVMGGAQGVMLALHKLQKKGLISDRWVKMK